MKTSLAIEGPRLYKVATPEGISLPFVVASAGDRLGAFLIDFGLILLGTLVAGLFAGFVLAPVSRALGIADYLTKPVKQAELWRAIRAALGRVEEGSRWRRGEGPKEEQAAMPRPSAIPPAAMTGIEPAASTMRGSSVNKPVVLRLCPPASLP